MGDKSEIGWTDATWNPTVGCTRVSAGCDNCYAFALHDRRYAANHAAARIQGHTARYTDDRGEAVARARAAGAPLPFPVQYDLPFSRVQLLPDRLDQPLRWRKPRRIFVDSMADLFHEDVPMDFILRVFETMGKAEQHTFQVLTKRPERMIEFCSRYGIGAVNDVLPNVWLGVSVENQHWADERIPTLLATPAAVRFVSYEPALGPVDFSPWLLPNFTVSHQGERANVTASLSGGLNEVARAAAKQHLGWAGLDWVIFGGESGAHRHPLDPSLVVEWAASTREQCRGAGVAYFGKQTAALFPGRRLPDDARGLNDHEWPGRSGRAEVPA